MTANKGEGGTATNSQAGRECCMCGDCGLSHELFRCKVCQFRSQHRYCSNLYPKAESHRVCNWCLSLTQKEDNSPAEKKHNSSKTNSSSPCKNNSTDDDDRVKSKKRNSPSDDLKDKRSILRFQVNGSVKKHESPSPEARRRTIKTGPVSMEERLVIRRTKSDEISNRGISKPMFRNKVRRYKFLDEVSSL